MEQRRSGGFYYLRLGDLSPLLAAALLSLARDRFDPHARYAAGNRAIETRLIYRAQLDMLARDLTPPPRCSGCGFSSSRAA